MLQNILKHVAKNGSVVTALEDPFARSMGFRCRLTAKEWWTSLPAVKSSKFTRYFQSSAARRALATSLSHGGEGLDLGTG
jgi:hypothetical protein